MIQCNKQKYDNDKLHKSEPIYSDSDEYSEISEDEFQENIDNIIKGPRLCSLCHTTAPLIHLPISRDKLTKDDFTTFTRRKEFEQEQISDTELCLLRKWIEQKRYFLKDHLAPHSGSMKSFVQIFNQILLLESVLIVKRLDDLERKLILVPISQSKRLIRFFHDRAGGANQAPIAISAKIIRSFWLPALKRDVRLYVSCCPLCEKFIRLSRTLCAGRRPMEVGGRNDCLAMNIVRNKDSF